MSWTVPLYKRGDVDWAGRHLVTVMNTETARNDFDQDKWERSLAIIGNWRAAHTYPLNTFAVTLRRKARDIDPDAVIAQRTKRLWSIWHKLDRFSTMQLAQMQDIGGCRAIVQTAEQVRRLLDSYKRSSLRHSPRRITDYIAAPRGSGYRGIHIIWEYRSDKPSKAVYNGLKIEMQLRSTLEHAWATTVETIGTLTRQALKSSLGDDIWLKFFALMGTAIAFREGTPAVPETPTNHEELVQALRTYATRVNAANRLRTIADAIHTLEQPSAQKAGAHFFLLELNPDTLQVTGFPANRQVEAQEEYVEVERRIAKQENSDAVLVSVDSLASLRRAYPNYFLDTRVFAEVLDDALAGRLLGDPSEAAAPGSGQT